MNLYREHFEYLNESVSKEHNDVYLKAVEAGDLETAQKMVDDAAKRAGYTINSYKGYYPKNWKTENPITVINRGSEFPAFNKEERGVKISGFFADRMSVAKKFAFSKECVVNHFYIKMKTPFTIDAIGKKAGELQFGESGKEFRDSIRSGKYDGVIIKNTSDEGTIFVTLRPEQSKLADPVVKDDSGNIIPLSQRFNDGKDDIRYENTLTENNKRYAYSWQTPSGRFIPIKSTHAQDAWEAGGKQPNTDYIMNRWKEGWNRIHYSGDSLYCHNEVMPPNERQKSELIDLAQQLDIKEIIYDGGEDYKVIWSIHDVLEELNEGAILIHPKDKAAIVRYTNDMQKAVDRVISKNSYIVSGDLNDVCQSVSDKLSSNIFPFNIEYKWSPNFYMAWYNPEDNTLGIDVSYNCKWESEKINGKNVNGCVGINFKNLIEKFIHEFVHYIQSETRKEKSGEYKIPPDWSDRNKYYKRGWEQQAHALEYLEKLKRKFNIKTADELLKHLKLTGLMHNTDLQKLKKTDYKSWKATMKQAIMSAAADIVDK